MLSTYFAIIPHGVEPLVLLLPHQGGWTLPFYRMEGQLESLGTFTRALKEVLGMELVVLRSPAVPREAPAGHQVVFYWVENRGVEALPPGACWIEEHELKALPGLDTLQVSALEGWFEELRSTESLHRSPWARSGWHDEATTWIAEQLMGTGPGAIVSIEQVRSWSITQVLRVTTERGII